MPSAVSYAEWLSNLVSKILPGYKTLLGALGLLGAGLIQLSKGDIAGGISSIGLGLSALGIRYAKE